jgi:hypothetical protein
MRRLVVNSYAAEEAGPQRFLVNAATDPIVIAHKLCQAGNGEPLQQRRPFGDHWLAIKVLQVDPELRESCPHLHKSPRWKMRRLTNGPRTGTKAERG